MTDMIERAAQALCALKFDGDIIWDMQDDLAKEVYRKGARAVMEAMREPTEAMINSPMARCYNNGQYADKEVRRIYSAMIDVALAPHPNCP